MTVWLNLSGQFEQKETTLNEYEQLQTMNNDF